MEPSPREVTRLLEEWGHGRTEARDQLMPLVYDELRRLAGRHLRRHRPDPTLQATVLVHEAYLRLVGQAPVRWQGRAQFFGLTAHLMRQIIIDHARQHLAAKRGGAACALPLDAAAEWSAEGTADLLALDDALRRLETVDPQQSRIVELRFFGGMTGEEIAECLDISPRTVDREWRAARAWLHSQVKG